VSTNYLSEGSTCESSKTNLGVDAWGFSRHLGSSLVAISRQSLRQPFFTCRHVAALWAPPDGIEHPSMLSTQFATFLDLPVDLLLTQH
jgi:hypothetical protein